VECLLQRFNPSFARKENKVVPDVLEFFPMKTALTS